MRCAAPSWGADRMTFFLSLTAIFTSLALPALAQGPASSSLPPAGKAPVDEIASISDTAPDSGISDADTAHLSCAFQTECIDAECAKSGYNARMTVLTDGAGLAEVEWVDPSETIAMAATIEHGAIIASSQEEDGITQRMLTVHDDGVARYTAHLGNPLITISYIGNCE